VVAMRMVRLVRVVKYNTSFNFAEQPDPEIQCRFKRKPTMIPAENPASFGTQNAITKSTKAVLIRRIARLVRQEGIDYEGWRYVAKKSGRFAG
jgi:hypothetical protein